MAVFDVLQVRFSVVTAYRAPHPTDFGLQIDVRGPQGADFGLSEPRIERYCRRDGDLEVRGRDSGLQTLPFLDRKVVFARFPLLRAADSVAGVALDVPVGHSVVKEVPDGDQTLADGARDAPLGQHLAHRGLDLASRHVLELDFGKVLPCDERLSVVVDRRRLHGAHRLEVLAPLLAVFVELHVVRRRTSTILLSERRSQMVT